MVTRIKNKPTHTPHNSNLSAQTDSTEVKCEEFWKSEEDNLDSNWGRERFCFKSKKVYPNNSFKVF